MLVVALVASTGFHWAALQSVAWTTMLANNLRTQSLSEAVSETFDGKHLCPLCRAIAAAKKSEKKSAAISAQLKMEFPPLAANFILISPKGHSACALSNLAAASSFPKPPVPPPRDLFV